MNQELGKPARLKYLPISFFAVVMGLAGLTIAWEKAQHLMGVDLQIDHWLVAFVSTVFVGIASLYAAKLLFYRDSVLKELQHPIKLNFFPAISVSLLLLSIAFLAKDSGVSRILWFIGITLHLLFTLYVVNTWIHQEHFEIHHMNPAWFIPAVGNVLVPIAGVPLGYVDISWFFFSIGMLFWVLLMTIIFYRMLFHNPIDQKLMPTLFILIAPPAVGFIAYIKLVGDLDAFSRILYFSGLFLTLLLFTQALRFIRLEFSLAWWAYSFPLAAISIASMVMFELTGSGYYLWISSVLLIILTAIVALLIVRTVQAVSRHRICLPGQ